MRYVLHCLHCGASIIATERVSAPEVKAVETHLRADYAHLLPTVGRLDFAEVLGHVREDAVVAGASASAVTAA